MHRPRGVRYFGSLLLGYYDAGGRLRYAGRVGTGFSEEWLREVHKRLLPLERKTSPLTVKATDLPTRPHWVEPKLVGEIRFGEWTRDRHVRHPAFLGLREDKRLFLIVARARPSRRRGPSSAGGWGTHADVWRLALAFRDPRVIAPDCSPEPVGRASMEETHRSRLLERPSASLSCNMPDRALPGRRLQFASIDRDVAAFCEFVAAALVLASGRPARSGLRLSPSFAVP
jgi:hypothetical protein